MDWFLKRQTHLILHLLGLTVALAAIVTLPVCHASAFVPVTDADARTITEQRDITEIVTTPGLHLLHQGYSAIDECESCEPVVNPLDGPQRSHADEVAQRVAMIPSPLVFDIAPAPLRLVTAVAPLLTFAIPPDFPPPQ